MKIEIKGWIFFEKSSYENEFSYRFSAIEADKYVREGDVCIRVCEHTIHAEVPEGFDPTAEHIRQLNSAKEKLRREFNARIAQINNQISKLQAIEYDAGAIVEIQPC
ncbi:hypothetical protein [Ensifer sp. SSB1]|uniref:hypothetical protein n=1 Tax=Ensifer sp. SSB1 TaxID=2795385 RepID=UPI001A58E888|nr:hypothetical protein [Ensifer sp. SSB1]MBK5571790.1 hypothetical protein [Ensifer sp. SSB1]